MRLSRHDRLLERSLRQVLFRRSPYAVLQPRHFSDDVSAEDGSNNVAVLGGGITGLATAYYLAKEAPKARITVYEASSRMGGWMSSKKVDVEGGHVFFEQGPRTLRMADNGIVTCKLVGHNLQQYVPELMRVVD